MATVAFGATMAIMLGIGQLYAGAGGVAPTCVRLGQALCASGLMALVVVAVAGCH
jgi:hypothetical protein